ncbi:MAG: OmpW family outer membrane protein, partial [Luteimonas sp.]
SASYHFNSHWAVELWASEPYGQRFKSQGASIGSVDAQPLALSAQYHFRDADKILRPFVGLGYHETNYDRQTGIFVAPVGFETVKGGIATAGLDVTLSPSWFARVDARYLEGSADLTVDNVKVQRTKFEPVMVSVGVGVRF